MACTPPNEIPPFDPDATGPDIPGGSGQPDPTAPEEPTVQDTNVNYCVDEEDPFQKPDGDPVPYEIWELPEEGVTKPWTFVPRKTKNGAAWFSYETKRVRELYRPYESSGTLKYMPYGNHTLPEGLPTINNDITDTVDGVEYKISFHELMGCPVVDGYRMVLFFTLKGGAIDDDMMITFWDSSTRTIAHTIRATNSYKELVIDRCPDAPGTDKTNFIGLTGSNGTNLTSSLYGTDYEAGDQRYHATQVQGKDITKIKTGYKPDEKTDPFEPRQYAALNYFPKDNQIEEWNRYNVNYTPAARVISGYAKAYATPDEDVIAVGCRARHNSGAAYGADYSFHPFTIKLPSPVTSVTTLDFDILTWQPFQYAKHLYGNGLATAESMSMSALAKKENPNDSWDVKYKFEDVAGKKTGIAPLGNTLPYDFPEPAVSDSGLRMAVQARINFLKQYQGRTPDSTLEFARASDTAPWVFQGATCDSIWFDKTEFPDDWEAAPFHTVRNIWRQSADLQETPFYDGDTLWVCSSGLSGFRGSAEKGRLRLYRPDFPNCSFKRDEGMTALAEYVVTIPDAFNVAPRRKPEWTPTNCIFSVRGNDNVYYDIVVDFIAGTWQTFKDAGIDPPTFPPRLAHLEENDWYKFTSHARRPANSRTHSQGQLESQWPHAYFDRSSVMYNGFRLVGIRDTPLVPNAGLGDIDRFQDNPVEGAYQLRQSRRVMLNVGEVVAYDSNGVEVWRCEPHDAREWVKFRTDNRTIGREMLAGYSKNQTTPNRGFLKENLDPPDPELLEFLGDRGAVSTLIGIDRVAFGDRLVLDDNGTDLYISHDSLPLGEDVPANLVDNREVDWYKFFGAYTIKNATFATPRGATKIHTAGYVKLDLTTIPELNP